MSISFHKAVRMNTPIIVGLSGPSKSGKTYSALRLATGMANGGQVAMINTEGPRGHSYADKFNYVAYDLVEPFSMKRYEEAIKAASELKPSVLIIDSVSHSHEGTGGMLDFHETELDRLAGNDYKKRDKMTWAAWIKPKADEANMINTMLRVGCSIILCFRAKEKLKIVPGKQPIDLGWQPIGSERIHFETAFTLTLPPFSKGKPDMEVSMLREPFDTMIKGDIQLNEALGKQVAEWAKGGAVTPPTKPEDLTAEKQQFEQKCSELGMSTDEITAFKKHLFRKAPSKSELMDVITKFTDLFDEFVAAQTTGTEG